MLDLFRLCYTSFRCKMDTRIYEWKCVYTWLCWFAVWAADVWQFFQAQNKICPHCHVSQFRIHLPRRHVPAGSGHVLYVWATGRILQQPIWDTDGLLLQSQYMDNEKWYIKVSGKHSLKYRKCCLALTMYHVITWSIVLEGPHRKKNLPSLILFFFLNRGW